MDGHGLVAHYRGHQIVVVDLQGDVTAEKRIRSRTDQQVTLPVLHLDPLWLKGAEIFLQPPVQLPQARGVDLSQAAEGRQKPQDEANEYSRDPSHLTSGNETPLGMNCDRSPWWRTTSRTADEEMCE